MLKKPQFNDAEKVDYCDCDYCVEYGNMNDEVEEFAKSEGRKND